MMRSRTLRPLGLSVLVLAAASTAWAARPAGDAAPASVTIRIHLANDAIYVTPPSVTIRPGDQIIWESPLTFAVDVARGAALFGRVMPPQALRGQANAPIRITTAANAPSGSYKYAVAVWDGTNVWVVDPEIIISPN